MRELLRLHAEGRVVPEPFAGLGDLPANASRAMRALHDLLSLRFGLRLADGTSNPMMLATSELVAEGIVATKGGASHLLHQFEALGIIWSPGSMPKLGKGDGTRTFLPGPKPEGPEPQDGWRVQALDSAPVLPPSDRTPGAVFEAGSVAVEREDVVAGIPVDPPVEAPDEVAVADAVPASGGDVGTATGGAAASGGGAVIGDAADATSAEGGFVPQIAGSHEPQGTPLSGFSGHKPRCAIFDDDP